MSCDKVGGRGSGKIGTGRIADQANFRGAFVSFGAMGPDPIECLQRIVKAGREWKFRCQPILQPEHSLSGEERNFGNQRPISLNRAARPATAMQKQESMVRIGVGWNEPLSAWLAGLRGHATAQPQTLADVAAAVVMQLTAQSSQWIGRRADSIHERIEMAEHELDVAARRSCGRGG